MKITYPDGSVKEIGIKEISVKELLQVLGINPIGVVIAKEGKIIPNDGIVRNEDNIVIHEIVSGG